MAIQTGTRRGLLGESGIFRFWAAQERSARLIFAAIGAVLLLNLAMLAAYQHYLNADFPFQDEWGFLHRLQILPHVGFFHYLFNRYQSYYMPVYLFVWYLFYKFAHLNFFTIRYTGAAVSTLVSLLLCVMLYWKAARLNWITILVILSAPFIVCSYDHWASWNQSIESVNEPLLFGLVLGACWIAEKTLPRELEAPRPGAQLGWSLLCIAIWLVATGIYANALVLLAAVAAARLLSYRRLDGPLVLMSAFAVLLPALYVAAGKGLNHQYGAAHSAIQFGDIGAAVHALLGLAGNALFSPYRSTFAGESFALLLGALILLVQASATIYVLRLPVQRRSRFMVPLTLTIYNALVLLEIVAARLHEPNLAFTPRYSILMLAAPVSVLFWAVQLVDWERWGRVIGVGTAFFAMLAVIAADVQMSHELRPFQHFMARDRAVLMSLQGEPDTNQQGKMEVTRPLLPYVYPDRLFLQEQRLAMYLGAPAPPAAETDAPTQTADTGALRIERFGPALIKAKTAFDVQRSGESGLWIRMNQEMVAKTYVVINGTKLPAVHKDNLVTASVPPGLYAKAGDYPMFVLEVMGSKNVRSAPVHFVVQ